MTIVQQNPFDAIRKVGDNGAEFWSAREMMGLLGYSNWQNMREVLDRAEAACRNSGQEAAGNFLLTSVKSQGRPAEDVNLSRYAAYLVAMNGDPRKPEIASAQTYFAIIDIVLIRTQKI
jgi:DNA-damage-inducible protein D